MIGIDIGGTNIDAVLLDEDEKILRSCKIPQDLGVEQAIKALSPPSIKAIHIGTTLATNAILEGKGLFKVGVIRLAGQRPGTLDPCFKWPEHLRDNVFVGVRTVMGGYRCDSLEMAPLKEAEIKQAFKELRDLGMESLAVVGVFSPLCGIQEDQVREIIGDFPITLSSEIGGMGFIARENAAILNAALKKPMKSAFERLETLGPIFITQNDGSLLTVKEAIEKPLLTISSGPTNSFIGGVKIAGLQDALIVDIGGTSVDIGIVLSGYPRRSLGQATIGGIPLNFRMPDVISLPIGGGSVIRQNETGFTIGPDSIGCRLFKEGVSFGGDIMTLTCAAKNSIKPVLESALNRVQEGIRLMRGSQKHIPVLAVGGGAFMLQDIVDQIPENSGVANAYGSALAEISYTVDTVISLEENKLESIKEEALQCAMNKGSKAPRIVDMQVIPYHYIPGKMARIVVTASGRR